MNLLQNYIIESTFVLASLPIVYSDQKDMEISLSWLILLPLSVILVSSFLKPYALQGQLLGASAVLTVGGALLLLLQGKLGEADVLYAMALALVCTFASFVVSLILACFGAVSIYFSRAVSTKTALDYPIAFTPLILWGFVSQLLLFRGSL